MFKPQWTDYRLKEDESGEQLTMSELGPFTSGK